MGLFQLFEQTRGLARHDDEGSLVLLIRLDSIATIEPSISPCENSAHATGHGGKNGLEMARNLRSRGPISVAQLTADIFPGLGDKGKNRLVALLSFILRVVALARPHLPTVESVHRRIGIESDRRQSHVRCFPNSFPQQALQLQQLLGDGHWQGGQETPEGTLRW